jgi:hypothetical protein
MVSAGMSVLPCWRYPVENVCVCVCVLVAALHQMLCMDDVDLQILSREISAAPTRSMETHEVGRLRIAVRWLIA